MLYKHKFAVDPNSPDLLKKLNEMLKKRGTGMVRGVSG